MAAYLGVTPPISVAPPSARDLEVSKTLIQELQDRGVYEKPEEGRNREIVLARLDKLVKQFVYQSSLNHGLSEAKAREASVPTHLFSSRSHRLTSTLSSQTGAARSLPLVRTGSACTVPAQISIPSSSSRATSSAKSSTPSSSRCSKRPTAS